MSRRRSNGREWSGRVDVPSGYGGPLDAVLDMPSGRFPLVTPLDMTPLDGPRRDATGRLAVAGTRVGSRLERPLESILRGPLDIPKRRNPRTD
jgi:hypothetical protein